MNLKAINNLSTDEFVEHFGDVAEHSPWVGAHAAGLRPFASVEAMVDAFTAAVMAATEVAQLQLIRAHPDLGTRAKLTAESKAEQKGARLDSLTADEMARFTHLNDLYKSRFDFPFIFAVKGADKHMIMDAFAERVNNTRADEFKTALAQVGRIFRYRIEDRVQA